MIPLSYAQGRLWFLYRFEGPSVTYNLPVVLRLWEAVDVGVMGVAVRDVVVRHESLRTVIGEDERGVAFQRILSPDEVVVEVASRVVERGEVAGAVAEAVAYEFELESEIPIRVGLLECGPQEFVLVILMHHIAGDAASMAPLARDLSVAYAARAAGREPGWAPLPVQYADYTLWQQELLGELSDPESIGSSPCCPTWRPSAPCAAAMSGTSRWRSSPIFRAFSRWRRAAIRPTGTPRSRCTGASSSAARTPTGCCRCGCAARARS